MKSTFDGKRVIVAGCAAIAMVLGAMSVGDSFFPSDRGNNSTQASALASAGDDTKNAPTNVSNTAMHRQRTLEVRSLLQQQSSPLLVKPAPTSQTVRNNNVIVAPILGTTNPLLFMDQMALPQVQPASDVQSATPPSSTGDGQTSGDKPVINPDDTATPPTKDGSGMSGDTTTPGDGSSAPQTQSLNTSGGDSSNTPAN